MKCSKSTVFLLTLTLILTANFLYSEAQEDDYEKNIAVFNLDARGVSDIEAKAITDRLRIELQKSGEYRLLERDMMNMILEEQSFQLSGACSEASCLVEVGQLLAVNKIVGGSVTKIGSLFTIEVRIVDVETGEIFKNVIEDYNGPIENVLLKTTKIIANKLLGQSGEWGGIQVGSSDLVISSNPPGAKIYLNDKPTAEITPATISGVADGTYKLYLKKDNLTATKTITVVPNQLHKFELVLKPEAFKLRIYSEPTGADVFLIKEEYLGSRKYYNNAENYKKIGQTPLDHTVYDSTIEYSLYLNKNGYNYHQEVVKFSKDNVTRLKVLLAAEKTCVVAVNNPTENNLLIDFKRNFLGSKNKKYLKKYENILISLPNDLYFLDIHFVESTIINRISAGKIIGDKYSLVQNDSIDFVESRYVLNIREYLKQKSISPISFYNPLPHKYHLELSGEKTGAETNILLSKSAKNNILLPWDLYSISFYNPLPHKYRLELKGEKTGAETNILLSKGTQKYILLPWDLYSIKLILTQSKTILNLMNIKKRINDETIVFKGKRHINETQNSINLTTYADSISVFPIVFENNTLFDCELLLEGENLGNEWNKKIRLLKNIELLIPKDTYTIRSIFSSNSEQNKVMNINKNIKKVIIGELFGYGTLRIAVKPKYCIVKISGIRNDPNIEPSLINGVQLPSGKYNIELSLHLKTKKFEVEIKPDTLNYYELSLE